jgi:hypothetical protein
MHSIHPIQIRECVPNILGIKRSNKSWVSKIRDFLGPGLRSAFVDVAYDFRGRMINLYTPGCFSLGYDPPYQQLSTHTSCVVVGVGGGSSWTVVIVVEVEGTSAVGDSPSSSPSRSFSLKTTELHGCISLKFTSQVSMIWLALRWSRRYARERLA